MIYRRLREYTTVRNAKTFSTRLVSIVLDYTRTNKWRGFCRRVVCTKNNELDVLPWEKFPGKLAHAVVKPRSGVDDILLLFLVPFEISKSLRLLSGERIGTACFPEAKNYRSDSTGIFTSDKLIFVFRLSILCSTKKKKPKKNHRANNNNNNDTNMKRGCFSNASFSNGECDDVDESFKRRNPKSLPNESSFGRKPSEPVRRDVINFIAKKCSAKSTAAGRPGRSRFGNITQYVLIY